MIEHSKLFSPSARSRWNQCPGSVIFTADDPRTTNRYADEGTAAHQFLQTAFILDTDPLDLIGEKTVVDGVKWELTGEMAAHISGVYNDIRGLAGVGVLLTEVKVDFKFLLPDGDYDKDREGFGTVDVITYLPENKWLSVHDLKYGMTPVGAEGNDQLLLYAVAALEMYPDAEGVSICIHQPRNGGMKCVEVTPYELREEAIAITAEMARALQPNAEFISGEEQCKYCTGAGRCPELVKVKHVFDDNKDVATLEQDKLGEVLPQLKLMAIWMEAVEQRAKDLAFAGTPPTGYKLVAGRNGPRKWASPEEAEALLKKMRIKSDEMYDRKVISPTTAEKVVGERQWSKLEALIVQDKGKPSLVPVSDKRPAMGITAEDFQE